MMEIQFVMMEKELLNGIQKQMENERKKENKYIYIVYMIYKQIIILKITIKNFIIFYFIKNKKKNIYNIIFNIYILHLNRTKKTK